jgi:hypothetical protein
MAAHDNPRPPWTSRLLATGGYLGVAPLLWLVRRNRDDVYVAHHEKQALAAQWLLFVSILGPIQFLPLQTYVFIHHDDWNPFLFRVLGGVGLVLISASCIAIVRYRLRRAEPIAFLCLMVGGLLLPMALPGEMTGLLVGLGLWVMLSLLGIGMALAGSLWPIPLVARLGHNLWLTRLAFFGNSLLLVLSILFVGVAIQACSLARDDVVPAPVYFLFDNREYPALGTWGPKLICYRVSRVAQQRWGPGSVVVAPIIEKNIRTAITHGRFVVLISHGVGGQIVTADSPIPGHGKGVAPDFRAEWATPAKDLQFVYIAACEGGQRATEWQQKFAPAEVVTFDRTSGGIEHIWWLWFDAPNRLRQVR